jgi:hypothetical protein
LTKDQFSYCTRAEFMRRRRPCRHRHRPAGRPWRSARLRSMGAARRGDVAGRLRSGRSERDCRRQLNSIFHVRGWRETRTPCEPSGGQQSPALLESAKRRIGLTGGKDRSPPHLVIHWRSGERPESIRCRPSVQQWIARHDECGPRIDVVLFVDRNVVCDSVPHSKRAPHINSTRMV